MNRRYVAPLIAVIMAALTLSVVFPVESSVRWLLYVILLIALAVAVTRPFFTRAPEVIPLVPSVRAEPERSGDLARLVTTIRRAERGLQYSRHLVAFRVREAFLGKLKIRRGLSQVELDELVSNGEALQSVVKNPVILDFLSKTAAEEVPPSRPPSITDAVLEAAPGRTFTREIARVVEAVEAWD